MKSDIEKQRHSSRTTIGQTLRGVTTKKAFWGRNKKPKFGNDANLEINVLPYVFLVQALHMPISMNSAGVYRPKYKTLRTSRLPRFAHVSIPLRCGTDTAGRGAFEPPPEDVFYSFKPCKHQTKQKTLKACRRQAKQTLESMPPQNSKH